MSTRIEVLPVTPEQALRILASLNIQEVDSFLDEICVLGRRMLTSLAVLAVRGKSDPPSPVPC